MKQYVGLDVSQDQTSICVVDEESIKMCGVLRLRRLASGRHLRPGTIF
jgi:hypothetical protein